MFSGGTFNGSKLKSQLKMASSQFQISANKKTSLLKQNMKEIAMYLQEEPPKIEKAKLRTEAFIHDDNLAQALDILHCQCDLLIPRVKLIEYSKNGHQPPQDIVSCVSTLIYATPYVDVKELSLISKQFRHKYGKEFEENALKNTNSVVNEKIVSLLSHQPDKQTVQKYMIGICKHFDVRWEPTSVATASSSSSPPSPPPPSNPNYHGSKNTNSTKQNNQNTINEEFDKYKYYDIQPEDIVVVAMPDQPNQPKNNNHDGKGNLPSLQQQEQKKRESTTDVTDTGNMDVIAEAVFIGEQQQQLQPNHSTTMTTTKSDILNRPLKELRKSHYRNQQQKEQLVVEPPSPSVVDNNTKIESTKKMNMNKNHAATESHGNDDEKDITKEEIEELNRQLPLPMSSPIQRKPKSPPPPSDQGDDDNGDDLVVVDKKGPHHVVLEEEKDEEEQLEQYMKSIKSNNNNKELEVTTTNTKNFDDDFVTNIRKLLPSPPSEDVSPEPPRPTSMRTMSPKQQQKLPPQIPKSLFFRKAPLSEQTKEKRIMSELAQPKEEKLEVVKQQQEEEDAVVFMKNKAKEKHTIRAVDDKENIIEEKKQSQLPHQQTQQASHNNSVDIKNNNGTESRDEIPTKTSRETNIVPTLSLTPPKSSSNNSNELIPPSTMEAQLPVVSAVSVAEMMNNNERNMEISTATTEEEEQLKLKQEKKKRSSMIAAAAGVVGGVAGLVAPVVTVGVVAGVSSALAAKKISKKMNKNKQHKQQTPTNNNSVGTMKFGNNATAIKLSS